MKAKTLWAVLLILSFVVMSACGTEGVIEETPPSGDLTPPSSSAAESVFPEAGYVMNLAAPSCAQVIVNSEAVYSAPSELSARVNYDYKPLENTYCLVIAECVAYTEEDWESGKDIWQGKRWLLVSFIVDGAPQSDIGWVPGESCVEYNEDTRELISGPFTAPGAEAYSLSEAHEPITLSETDILYASDLTPNEDGYVKASLLGSAGCWIRPEDLVYPAIGESYFK